MYKQFFGLEKEPFTMTVDPSFLFLTEAHREALAGLTYAVLNRKGFVVLTGEAGTGKTTLLGRTLQCVPATRAIFSVISNPTLTPGEFLELALIGFGIKEVPASKSQRLMKLEYFLMGAHSTGRTAVLVVDEAQRLPPDVLEEIRLLSNFELPDQKLLQIVLAGQSELAETLNRNDLRQLKQRIAVRLAIQPLSQIEVGQYLRHRWSKAGGMQPPPFDAGAVGQIARYSRGIPRLVNALCDNALVSIYGKGITAVSADHVLEAARDLQLFDAPIALAESAKAPVVQPVYPTAAVSKNGNLNGSGNLQPMSIPSLERYVVAEPKSSRLARWFARGGRVKSAGVAL
jgi:general secretion pathway protein A